MMVCFISTNKMTILNGGFKEFDEEFIDDIVKYLLKNNVTIQN